MYNFLHDMHWVLPLRTAWATPIAQAFTFLGYTPFFLIFLPLIYWFWDRALFIRLAIVIVLSSLLNEWLKDFWQDPRPPVEIQLDHARVLDSYGRPSGHAQGAAVMWLWLANEIKRGWAWPVAGFIALGVGLSRLYLGVHDIDDVLTGFAVGIALFFVMRWLFSLRLDAVRRLPLWSHFLALMVLNAALTVFWPGPDYPDSAMDLILFFANAYLGYVIDVRLAPGPLQRPVWWIAVPSGIAGILLLFALRAGAGYAVLSTIPDDPSIVSGFQALVVGLYITLLAPVTFRALGILKPANSAPSTAAR